MENIVRVQGLNKSFGDVTAVKNLSFSVDKGEIFGLIGPDGAGKTTTLRMLSGIMTPVSGEVSVLGYNLPAQAEAVKENIGYMPQKFSLYTDLTVEENIKFFADVFQIKKDVLESRLEPLLKMTRLDPFRDRLAGNLSGGMKQKLALMATLIHRPKLLMLDEPTTGVDPVSRREFWEILQQIRTEGVTIIVSTPYMDEAEWCSKVGLLHDGGMLSLDTPAKIKESLHGIVVEITSKTGNVEVKGIIENNAGVMDAQIFGSKYHVVLKDKNTFDELEKMSGDKFSIREIPVSVEDVFVNKMKKVKQ